jgi:hypothetical protein
VLLAPEAPLARDMRIVVFATVSLTKTSVSVSVSSGLRFDAAEWKAT